MEATIKRKADELWNYLPHVPNTTKKPNQTLKRKSEVTEKEVLNLTGGLFPLKLIESAKDVRFERLIENNSGLEKVDHWVCVPIKQRNTKIGPIYHWVKEGEEEKVYHGDKFNIEPEIIEFTSEEYKKINVDHELWPYEEVNEIFSKLKNYNFNFIVVQDRIEGDRKWSIEELKDIYFTVSRLIAGLNGEKDTVRSNYHFDKKYEINRKFELEKYLMRSKVEYDREKNLINEIRRLEIQIKKEEREQINLKKVLKLDEIPEEVFKLQESTNVNELLKSQQVYTRQQILSKPIGLPGKIEEKMTEVLSGLNIPEKILVTKQNAELYDTLRKKILIMFSLNRYIRKRENEKKSLEDKKKRVSIQEEENRNNRSVNPLGTGLGQPHKKVKN